MKYISIHFTVGIVNLIKYNLFTPGNLIKIKPHVLRKSDDEVGRECTVGPLSVSGSGCYYPTFYFQLARALRPSPMVRPAISMSESYQSKIKLSIFFLTKTSPYLKRAMS